MEKMNGNDNRQLIEAAKERLRWYTVEASEEEFDAEEVDALVNLLSTLEPVETEEVQSDEEALKRFHAYVEMREAEDGISSEESVAKQKKNGRLAGFVCKHKYVAAAAAVLIMIVIAGGSFGAVNAGKGDGFFYWLKKDKEGMTMITSPENLDNSTNIEGAVEYSREEDVPEEYQKYLVDLSGIELLDEYEMECVWVTQFRKFVVVNRCFFDNLKEKRIYVGGFIYPNRVSMDSEVHLSKDVEGGIGDNKDGEILIKESPSGTAEYTIFFYHDNVQYYVEGDVDKEILVNIAMDYRDIVFE